MHTFFDIPADLDTPVSAYLKLEPLGGRFLLESVGGSGQNARYSFLGFGDATPVSIDALGPEMLRLLRRAERGEREPREEQFVRRFKLTL